MGTSSAESVMDSPSLSTIGGSSGAERGVRLRQRWTGAQLVPQAIMRLTPPRRFD